MTVQRIHLFITAAFLLSTLFTIAFIARFDGYISTQTMALSGTIAGAKWAIQILIGFFTLHEKRWVYISQLAATCLTGSVILLPFAINPGSRGFFFGSLAAAVLIMAIDLFRRFRLFRFPVKWYLLWLGLLAIAVTLQLTIVFHII